MAENDYFTAVGQGRDVPNRRLALQYMHEFANKGLRPSGFQLPPEMMVEKAGVMTRALPAEELEAHLRERYGADDQLVNILKSLFAGSFEEPEIIGKGIGKTPAQSAREFL